MLIVVVSVIVGLCVICGGIFAIVKITNNNNNTSLSDSNTDDDDSDSNDDTDDTDPSDSAQPSYDSDAEETDSSFNTGNEALSIFDAVTQDSIIAVCEETGLDVSKIIGLESYGEWYDGTVYTFMYDGSVIDILLYDDGTVYSLETNGTQVYLMGYESYSIDDYIGYMSHFDESYPANGYAFYLNGSDVDSTAVIETSTDLDYVIELINPSDGSLASAFYIRAGYTWNMDVPAGDYYIQYAAGADWGGVDYLFGSDTVIYKSDSIYSFYTDSESTITLDIYGGTGIPSTEISIDDF